VAIDDYVFEGWESKFKASVVDKHVGDFRQWYLAAFERLRMALEAFRKA
jgi:hypothetical protein